MAAQTAAGGRAESLDRGRASETAKIAITMRTTATADPKLAITRVLRRCDSSPIEAAEPVAWGSITARVKLSTIQRRRAGTQARTGAKESGSPGNDRGLRRTATVSQPARMAAATAATIRGRFAS